MRYEVEIAGRRRSVDVRRAVGCFTVVVDDRTWSVDAVQVDRYTLSLLVTAPDAGERPAGQVAQGGQSHEVTLAPDAAGGSVTVRVGAAAVAAVLNGRRRSRPGGASDAGTGPERVVAPMPGRVVRVLVSRGESVGARQGLVVIEAMKMENELRAGRAGRVIEIAVKDGQLVDAGALLLVVADEG